MGCLIGGLIELKKSELELVFAQQVKEYELPEPEFDTRFHPTRRWRADFLWRDQMVIVELEGGTYTHGKRGKKSRHLTPTGFEADCVKYNAATEMGYSVYRYTSRMVLDERAIKQIRRILKHAR